MAVVIYRAGMRATIDGARYTLRHRRRANGVEVLSVADARDGTAVGVAHREPAGVTVVPYQTAHAEHLCAIARAWWAP